YQYPKTLVSFTQTNSNAASGTVQPGAEMEFRGTKGTLFILNKSFVILPENNYSGRLPVHTPLDRTLVRRYYSSGKTSIRGIKREGNTDTVWHTRNFVGAILTDKAPNCPIEEGHRSTTAALLANIALKQKALLEWNAETEEFTNNKEANALLKYEYREPYKFPAV
ncbi:MAG TPA: hypothetical protein PKA06_09920, partial [Gemmatales bacterium]|nr:hypothetical protein [Gemmatales bacterium]